MDPYHSAGLQEFSRAVVANVVVRILQAPLRHALLHDGELKIACQVAEVFVARRVDLTRREPRHRNVLPLPHKRRYGPRQRAFPLAERHACCVGQPRCVPGGVGGWAGAGRGCGRGGRGDHCRHNGRSRDGEEQLYCRRRSHDTAWFTQCVAGRKDRRLAGMLARHGTIYER